MRVRASHLLTYWIVLHDLGSNVLGLLQSGNNVYCRGRDTSIVDQYVFIVHIPSIGLFFPRGLKRVMHSTRTALSIGIWPGVVFFICNDESPHWGISSVQWAVSSWKSYRCSSWRDGFQLGSLEFKALFNSFSVFWSVLELNRHPLSWRQNTDSAPITKRYVRFCSPMWVWRSGGWTNDITVQWDC